VYIKEELQLGVPHRVVAESRRQRGAVHRPDPKFERCAGSTKRGTASAL
jgi:hypothetical protein